MKPWYKSKTLIVNAIAAALLALEASVGLIQPHLQSDFYAAFALGLAMVNAVLRVITSKPIGGRNV